MQGKKSGGRHGTDLKQQQRVGYASALNDTNASMEKEVKIGGKQS